MKVGITGISGYLGGLLRPLLENDPAITEIIGVDLRGPGQMSPKLTFMSIDIRDRAALERAFVGCEVIVHLAYVVLEIRDKKATHEININGSQAVCEAAAAVGAHKLIVASSVAAYGAHPNNPNPVPESWPTRGNPRHECYYSYDKAQVEAYLDRFSEDHPRMIVTRLRPALFLGPQRFEALRPMWAPRLAIALTQPDMPVDVVHEDDVARGFHLAIQREVRGAVNLGSGAPLRYRDLVEMAGQRLVKLPDWLVRPLADVAFRFGLAPSSSHWINLTKYPIVPAIERAAREFDWRPRYTGREAFQAMLAAARAAEQAAPEPSAQPSSVTESSSLG